MHDKSIRRQALGALWVQRVDSHSSMSESCERRHLLCRRHLRHLGQPIWELLHAYIRLLPPSPPNYTVPHGNLLPLTTYKTIVIQFHYGPSIRERRHRRCMMRLPFPRGEVRSNLRLLLQTVGYDNMTDPTYALGGGGGMGTDTRDVTNNTNAAGTTQVSRPISHCHPHWQLHFPLKGGYQDEGMRMGSGHYSNAMPSGGTGQGQYVPSPVSISAVVSQMVTVATPLRTMSVQVLLLLVKLLPRPTETTVLVDHPQTTSAVMSRPQLPPTVTRHGRSVKPSRKARDADASGT